MQVNLVFQNNLFWSTFILNNVRSSNYIILQTGGVQVSMLLFLSYILTFPSIINFNYPSVSLTYFVGGYLFLRRIFLVMNLERARRHFPITSAMATKFFSNRIHPVILLSHLVPHILSNQWNGSRKSRMGCWRERFVVQNVIQSWAALAGLVS